MATVYLVRHGEADYGPIRERRWPGAAADLAPLAASGSQQAMAAARQLATAGAAMIVSSPMTRALHTAALIGGHLGLIVQVDFDLREWLPDDTFSWLDHADVAARSRRFRALRRRVARRTAPCLGATIAGPGASHRRASPATSA